GAAPAGNKRPGQCRPPCLRFPGEISRPPIYIAKGWQDCKGVIAYLGVAYWVGSDIDSGDYEGHRFRNEFTDEQPAGLRVLAPGGHVAAGGSYRRKPRCRPACP